jgi:anthranilate synthase component 1
MSPISENQSPMDRHLPSWAEFSQLARGQSLVPVYRQLVSDSLTPVSAYCCLQPAESSFLFESVIGGERIGRYSFLGAEPRWIMEAYDREVIVREGPKVERQTVPDPLTFLQDRLAAFSAPHLAGLPRFLGGAVGYAGYDTVRYTEHLPHPPQDDRHIPDMVFAFYDRMVIFDQIRKTILVVAHAPVGELGVEAGYRQACQRIDELCDRLPRGMTALQLADIRLEGDPPTNYQSNQLPIELHPRGIRKRGPQMPGIHPCRRHLSSCHQPAADRADHGQAA